MLFLPELRAAAMDGWKSYTELLASVAGPGFNSLSANQWGLQSAALEIPPVDAFYYGDSHLDQSYSSAANLGSESSSSGGEEEDDAVRVPDPSNLDADETELADIDHYGAASDTFASEMHNAAAPVLPGTFVPPKSLYIKRKHTGKGQELPTCRPPSEVGAVEAALRASASKKTAQIFYPTPGTVFDYLAEAYEFYNLYSWEVGFGVRCYIWDISARDLLVLDPMMMNADEVRATQRHKENMDALCNALVKCTQTFFDGWSLEDGDWLQGVETSNYSGRCIWNYSGLYTMHYARWYCGMDLDKSISDVELGDVRADMFYQLLNMASNVGDLPSIIWRLK